MRLSRLFDDFSNLIDADVDVIVSQFVHFSYRSSLSVNSRKWPNPGTRVFDDIRTVCADVARI